MIVGKGANVIGAANFKRGEMSTYCACKVMGSKILIGSETKLVGAQASNFGRL